MQRRTLIGVLVLGLLAGLYVGTRGQGRSPGRHHAADSATMRRGESPKKRIAEGATSRGAAPEPEEPSASAESPTQSDSRASRSSEQLERDTTPPDEQTLAKSWRWPGDNGPQHDLNDDDSACRKETTATASAGDQLGAYRACMTAKGWQSLAADVDACREEAAAPRVRHWAFDACMKTHGWKWQPPPNATFYGRPPQYYVRPKTSAQRNRKTDTDLCRRYAWQHGVRRHAYDSCMMRRGWTPSDAADQP
jgi:hypothetical protein